MKTKDKKAKATLKAKRTLVRAPLSTLGGVIAETTKVYREARSGKINQFEARSLVWMLSQLRGMLETQALERIERKLEELEPTIEGHSTGSLVANRTIRLEHRAAPATRATQ